MFLKDLPNQLSEPSVISGDVANFPRGKRIQISGFRNVDYVSHTQGFDQYSFGEIMQIETLSEARDQKKIKKALLIRVTQQNQQVHILQKKFP